MVHVVHALQGAQYHKWRYNICDWEFTNFDAPFDNDRILCTYRTEGLPHGELIRISFFHKEGMARFVGVGIDTSMIMIPTSSSDIWVKEIDEEDWNQMWIPKSNYYTTLMLQTVDQNIDSPSTHGNREDEQLYKRLKGTSLLHGLVKRILQKDKFGSHGNVEKDSCISIFTSLLHGLIKRILQKDKFGSHGNVEKDSCISIFSGMTLSMVPKMIDAPLQASENGSTYQLLRVVVILNPHHTKLLEVDKIPRLPSPMAFLGEDDGVHEIEATMIVEFYYRKDGGGVNGIQIMQVTLLNQYGLESSTPPKNTNSSPWYHEKFSSYFKCLNIKTNIRYKERGVGPIHDMKNASMCESSCTHTTMYGFLNVSNRPAVHFRAIPNNIIVPDEMWWKDITTKAQFTENLSTIAYGIQGRWDLQDSNESYEKYEICMERYLCSTYQLIKNKIGIFETTELKQQLKKTILINHTFDQMSYCDQE